MPPLLAVLLSLACLLGVVLPPPALADKPAHTGRPDKGDHAPQRRGDARGMRGEPAIVAITPEARRIVHRYYGDAYARGSCPPGLAKKRNGCLPPGQAKKRYAIGSPLPRGIVVVPLPDELVIRLPAPPPGYDYRYLDGDVLLVAAVTQIVMDAIRALGR